MAGKRQHILPRLLQKGFATRIEGDEAFAWVYHRSRPAVETNTRNIAVEKYFYGQKGVEASADDEITDTEGQFVDLINDLRSRNAEHLEDARIPLLVAHLMTRTKFLREGIRESAEFMIETLAEYFGNPENLRQLIFDRPKWLDGELKRRFPEEWAGLNRVGRYLFRERARHLLVAPFQERIDEHLKTFRSGFGELQKALLSALREGHNKALAKRPASGAVAEHYSQHRWCIVETADPLVLGDSACVYEVATEQGTRFVGSHDGSMIIKNIFLPLAAHRLLIGTIQRVLPMVDGAKFNAIAASCSFELFVASVGTLNTLVPLIGSTARLIEPHELKRLGEVMIEEIAADPPYKSDVRKKP